MPEPTIEEMLEKWAETMQKQAAATVQAALAQEHGNRVQEESNRISSELLAALRDHNTAVLSALSTILGNCQPCGENIREIKVRVSKLTGNGNGEVRDKMSFMKQFWLPIVLAILTIIGGIIAAKDIPPVGQTLSGRE